MITSHQTVSGDTQYSVNLRTCQHTQQVSSTTTGEDCLPRAHRHNVLTITAAGRSMVLLGRVMVCSHRLTVQVTVVYETVLL